MKGLILKDLFSLKSNLKTIIIFVLGFAAIGIVSENNFLTTYASVYAAIVPMSCFSYDEMSRFNRYAAIMPVSASQNVLSKYILGIIFILLGCAVSVTAMTVGGKDVLSSVGTMVVIPLVYHAVTFPILFKYGVEKSRALTIGVFVVPFILFSLLAEIMPLNSVVEWINSFKLDTVIAAGIAVIAVMYILSVMLSINIYKNKEW